jgi:hypothetical protein
MVFMEKNIGLLAEVFRACRLDFYVIMILILLVFSLTFVF